jgi:hypothetical protein
MECGHPYENSVLHRNQRTICSPTGQAPKEKVHLNPKAGDITLFLWGVKPEISQSCLPTCQQELTLKGVKSMPSSLSKIVLAHHLCAIAEAGKKHTKA